MTTSFMRAAESLFTSESVTEGHPDKLCDQISDAVLDAILAEDKHARVACETSATTGLILVFGEITTDTYVDIPAIARQTVEEVGYTRAKYGFDAATAAVITSIKEQSREIADSVQTAWEVRSSGPGDEWDAIGAGDQGMMIGFACNETPELMPLPISLAHELTRRMAAARKSGELGFLRPDGKSQVTVEYHQGQPARLQTVVLSAQHDPASTQSEVAAGLIEEVLKPVVARTQEMIRPVVAGELLDSKTRILINPSGSFAVGGPMGDAGLTGRKIIVDTYGGMARHGGGAFSGKDPTKVDRSGAYAARYVAKNVVAAGLADRFEIQVSYAIGVARPVAIHIESFGTERVDEATILRLIEKHFDLRPGAIIRNMDLMRPLYRQVAAYGHFGRPDLDLPWEQTDKAALLREEAGLKLGEMPVAQ